MKKFVLAMVALLRFTMVCFAQEEEPYEDYYNFLVGLNYGSFFEKGFDYTGFLGNNMGNYHFPKDKDIGSFTALSMNYPLIGTDKYSSLFLFDQMFGIGFRNNINQRIELLYGIGFHYSILTGEYKENEADNIKNFMKSEIGLGIGGDVNLIYTINRFIFLNFGLTITYDFYTFITITTNQGNNKNNGLEHYLIGIKPYIAFGINSRSIAGRSNNESE